MKTLEQTVFTTDAQSFHDMENRKHTRHLCNDGSVMRLSIRPEFRARHALVVNVSTGGVGLLLEHSLDAGTVLVFELKSPRGQQPIGRIARVCHSRLQRTPPNAPWLRPAAPITRAFRSMFGLEQPRPDGLAWLVGCEFDRTLEDHEVTQFLERLK